MKVLHLFAAGGTGGIEVLFKNLVLKSKKIENICAFLFEEGNIYDELKSSNIETLSLKNIKYNEKVKCIAKYCIENNIDVIVMHHGGLNCNRIYIKLKKVLKNLNIKFIRYMHACFDFKAFGMGENFIKDIIIKNRMQKAIDYSDCIIYISEASKESFEKNFKINSEEKIIYNGVAENFFENVPVRDVDKEFNKLVYVGRLNKNKGVHLLIEAVNCIINSGKKVFLTVVGDGEERTRLEKMVSDLKLDEYITFLGRRDNVIEILDYNDIFVYPSTWEEGFGISVVEAMSRGCIPITFKKGGLLEIIKNEEDGFFADNVSDIELMNKINYVINYDNKKKIIDNAIENSKKFSINATLSDFEDIISKIRN